MVSFSGDKEMMYKANFCLRTAIRILKPIKHFTAGNADEVYNAVKEIAWEDYLTPEGSFAVDAVVFSDEFRHSKFVAYRVKDAIVDYFREKTGKRPSVRINNPDLSLNIHIAQDHCTLSLDSSGESLHRRGYRQEAVEAPLNEVLAAGMILLTGWHGECDLIDPMCGSGTIPIEAALIAKNRAPGLNRSFAAQHWAMVDKRIWLDAADEAMDNEFHDKTYEIWGGDIDPHAVEIARHNAELAEVDDTVRFEVDDATRFHWGGQYGRVVTNPPYGERLLEQKEAEELYRAFGRAVDKLPETWRVYVLSSHTEFERCFGRAADKKRKLYNGMLKCDLFMYGKRL